MRVAFLTHRLPYASNSGDRNRALHMLRLLARHAEVHLISLVHSDEEAAHTVDLEHLTASVGVARVSVIRSYRRAAVAAVAGTPLTHAMLDAAGFNRVCRALVSRRRPDVVLAYCSSMARFALEPPFDDIPMVLDMVDVDSEKWRALSHRTPAPMRWVYAAEAERLSRFERRAAAAAEAVFVVNGREERTLRALEPSARVCVLPIGVDAARLRPPFPAAASPHVVFCGVMSYAPNVEAVTWFARHVWPAVRTRQPHARFTVVGANPTAAVRALPRTDPTIEVTGTLPDVRQRLWQSAVAVAPLFVARGVQTKVVEAVAAGLPTVITPAVEEGVPAEIRPGCVVAADSDTFAAAVLELLGRTPNERRRMAAAADLQALDWSHRLQPMLTVLQAAACRSAVAQTLQAVS